MSDYRGHLWGGVVFFLGLAWAMVALSEKLGSPAWVAVFWGWKVLALFGVALLMALWPDVDMDSKGQRLFYRIFLAADALLIVGKHFQFAAILGLLAMIPIAGRHRGWTHTIWAAVLVALPFFVLPMYFCGQPTMVGVPYFLAALVGYGSHLILDRKFL
ncbi:MAG: metal-dependent hydrolase [Candidatus Latescibacterota bacterium]